MRRRPCGSIGEGDRCEHGSQDRRLAVRSGFADPEEVRILSFVPHTEYGVGAVLGEIGPALAEEEATVDGVRHGFAVRELVQQLDFLAFVVARGGEPAPVGVERAIVRPGDARSRP